MGRISHYTPELGESIAKLAGFDLGYKDIADWLGLGSERVISDLIYSHPELSEKLARARPARSEKLVDSIKSIEVKLENQELPSDYARVLIQSKQWRASRYNPKVYGDKMTLAGDSENPVMLLATRLDDAIKRERSMIDVTPAQPAVSDFSDLC